MSVVHPGSWRCVKIHAGRIPLEHSPINKILTGRVLLELGMKWWSFTPLKDSGNQNMISIGYWSSQEYAEGQKPVDESVDLPHPQHLVDATWDRAERDMVIAHLQAGETETAWKGYSSCRFGCDWHPEIGTQCLTDGTYRWPQGLPHYLKKHAVRLSQEFVDHVRTSQDTSKKY